jgi:hypothetical protein
MTMEGAMGQGIKPPGDSFRSGCAIGLVVGAFITAVVVIWILKEKPESARGSEFGRSVKETPKPLALEAAVELLERDVVIVNQGPDDWRNVRVQLNYHWRSGELDLLDYSFKFRPLGAGEQRTIPLKAFARADGRQFNTDELKVVLLEIFCDTPYGPAEWRTDIFN